MYLFPFRDAQTNFQVWSVKMWPVGSSMLMNTWLVRVVDSENGGEGIVDTFAAAAAEVSGKVGRWNLRVDWILLRLAC